MNNTYYDYHYGDRLKAFNSMSYSEPAYTMNTNLMTTLNILEVGGVGLRARSAYYHYYCYYYCYCYYKCYYYCYCYYY